MGIESHNKKKIKNDLSKQMMIQEAIENLAVFIDECYTQSSYNRYYNLKTKLDQKKTDAELVKYSLLLNSKGFSTVNEEYRKADKAKFELAEADTGFGINSHGSCYAVSESVDSSDCVRFSNFELPCSHKFFVDKWREKNTLWWRTRSQQMEEKIQIKKE